MEVYDRFDELVNADLQALNRVCLASNIKRDLGEAPFQEYVNSFDTPSKMAMYVMTMRILSEGIDKVRQDVTSQISFDFEDEDDGA